MPSPRTLLDHRCTRPTKSSTDMLTELWGAG
jgi:hypothetical protein